MNILVNNTQQPSKIQCIDWYSPMLKQLRIDLLQGKIAIDVGAKHGYITSFLTINGAEAFALDLDSTNIQEVLVRQRFIQGDAICLPFQACSLDLIIAFEVLEHIKNPDLALHEFYRCLKKGGILLLTTPTPKSPTATYPGHISVRSRAAWIKALKSEGFTVEIITYHYAVCMFHAPKCVNIFAGKLLGLWKHYAHVTSTKLNCIKKC